MAGGYTRGSGVLGEPGLHIILLVPSPTDTHTFTHTYIYGFCQGVVAYTYNPSIQEAKAGRLLQVQGQPDLHEMLSLKRKKEKKRKKREKRKKKEKITFINK